MAGDIFWRKQSREGLINSQLARLRAFLSNRVLPFNEFYRERFKQAGVRPDSLQTMSDLTRIPLMSKSDIVPDADNANRYRNIVLQPTEQQLRESLSLGDKARMLWRKLGQGQGFHDQLYDDFLPIHLTFTTGRSAMPTPVVYTKRDVDILKLAAQRIFALSGITRGKDTGVSVFPFAPHLAFWQVVFCGLESGLLVISTGGGRSMGSQAILRLLDRVQPTLVIGTPGYVYHLVQQAKELGIKLPKLRTVALGAERVNEAYRAKLKEHLADVDAPEVNVLATYGLTEAKKAWIQCSEGGRYITYPDVELFEVIDPLTGEQVAKGQPGEIVLTMLDGSGSVFIRYRTGDLVTEGLVYEHCDTIGRVAPMVGADIRRASEIRKVKDTLLDLNELHLMLQGLPEILEWQVELRKRDDDPFGLDEMWLKLALKEGVDPEFMERRINDEMHNRYELRFDRFLFYSREDLAKLLKLDDAPKELRILDNRPR